MFSDITYFPAHFHAPNGYVETSDHAINDLRPGETMTIAVAPLGRGLYDDNKVVGEVLTQTYQVQVGTPGENDPDDLNLSAKVFPNPNQGQGTLQLTSASSGIVTWVVIDALGSQVASGRQLLTSREVDLPLNLGPVAAGAYTLRVQQDANVITRRLTVVR